MADTQSPQTNSLKRKASSELRPAITNAVNSLVLPTQNEALVTTFAVNAVNAANSVELSTQNEAPGANTYQQTYDETTAEIKKLLKEYSMAASGDSAKVQEYHNNTKNELQAILNDIANRPEFVEMEEVKNVLRDCGIEIEVRQTADGVKFVDVQLKVE